MTRVPKWKTRRECQCGAILMPGERRCTLASHRAKPGKPIALPGAPAPEGSLNAAHFYHLHLSIANGSWADTGHRTAGGSKKSELAAVYDAFGGSGFTVSRTRQTPYRSFKDIEFFVHRCEIAKRYWRDEFAGLMGTRLLLWLGRCTNQKVADLLQIPLDSLRWLDSVIRKEFKMYFPKQHRLQNAEYMRCYRKMKAGVAADIIRRRRHGYKQSQALQPQQVDPFSGKLRPIYEGEKRAHDSHSDADSEVYRFCDAEARKEDYRANEID